MKKSNKGFTLVELLVVIAIIGILAVVAVPALFKNIEKGKVADLEADISAIRSASLSYYSETSKYPVNAKISLASGNVTSGVVTGVTDTDNSIKASADKIISELEGLSFPFKGSYEFSSAQAPAALVLTIKPGGNSKLSDNAIEKLENDLGKGKVKKVEATSSLTTETSEYTGDIEIIIIDAIK